MFNSSTPHVTPAYGRDFKNKCEVELAFATDRDFLYDGRPINKSQLIEMGHTEVNVRYGNNQKVHVIKFGPDATSTPTEFEIKT